MQPQKSLVYLRGCIRCFRWEWQCPVGVVAAGHVARLRTPPASTDQGKANILGPLLLTDDNIYREGRQTLLTFKSQLLDPEAPSHKNSRTRLSRYATYLSEGPPSGSRGHFCPDSPLSSDENFIIRSENI